MAADTQRLTTYPTTTSLAPSYTTLPHSNNNDDAWDDDEIELRPWGEAGAAHRRGASSSSGVATSAASITSSTTAPPPYLAGPGPHSSSSLWTTTTTFTPQVQLQVETAGKAWLSSPFPQRPDPIPVFGVGPDGATLSGPGAPSAAYVSLRHFRSSGTSCLVAGSSANADNDASPAVSDTTYRFGPGRPPRIRLWLPGAGPSVHSLASEMRGGGGSPRAAAEPGADATGAELAVEGSGGAARHEWDAFELQSVGVFTRAQRVKTRLGTFEWRYASKKEREAAGKGINSLLVLDRVVRVFTARNGGGSHRHHRRPGSGGGEGSSSRRGKEEEQRTQVARLVRSSELRSPGSDGSTAGNGGRLQIDLSLWDGEGGDGGEEKGEREMVVVLAVTTAICMLKKEVDRRRAAQIAIMANAASG